MDSLTQRVFLSSSPPSNSHNNKLFPPPGLVLFSVIPYNVLGNQEQILCVVQQAKKKKKCNCANVFWSLLWSAPYGIYDLPLLRVTIISMLFVLFFAPPYLFIFLSTELLRTLVYLAVVFIGINLGWGVTYDFLIIFIKKRRRGNQNKKMLALGIFKAFTVWDI